jgi:ferric-dicitrate binding protein FerR (iron transport regulator)
MNRDLRSVVADLNRYSDYTIVLEGGEVPHLRFSGVVHMEKITNWIDALPIVFDVDVKYVDEEILIQERAQL